MGAKCDRCGCDIYGDDEVNEERTEHLDCIPAMGKRLAELGRLISDINNPPGE